MKNNKNEEEKERENHTMCGQKQAVRKEDTEDSIWHSISNNIVCSQWELRT